MRVLKAKGNNNCDYIGISRIYYKNPDVFENKKKIIYPDSDGKRMADNTKQFNWIVKIKENLEAMFADNKDVFIAGDLLWYPVEGNNKLRMAPDAMVVFGRPKGYRGSYKMWEEDNVSPQVVFEILSPCNTRKEMERKLEFYEKYGVEEYYEYDPDKIKLKIWVRVKNKLTKIENTDVWISPKLKIRFEINNDDLSIFKPDGSSFLTTIEIDKELRNTQQDLELERQKAKKLAEKLKELGIEIE
ncbi:MAG: Uma2 family endonuclease [Desulfobacterales bacterium]|nr:Uma2 family endonuclease [Desulfobacterales bacterium]